MVDVDLLSVLEEPVGCICSSCWNDNKGIQ